MSKNDYDEFLKDKHSITYKMMRLFDAEPQDFIDWKWQLKYRAKSLDEIAGFIKITLDREKNLKDQQYKAGVTPYYLSLIRSYKAGSVARKALMTQVIPSQKEAAFFKDLSDDPLLERTHSPLSGLIHLYHDRVAFCVSSECPSYCRHCFRKPHLLEKKGSYDKEIISKGLAYIKKHYEIKEVLITGGDPFLADDGKIDDFLKKLRKISHVEVIRFGTRTPVTLPYRITTKLAKILSSYHPVWVNTQFNCSEEITKEAERAVSILLSEGIPVGNQSVLLKGVNDSPDRMKELLRSLIKIRVKPYYLFHPHLVQGTQHLRVSIDRGLEIMKSLRGNISGIAIPTYIVDTPTGKVPIGYNYVIRREGSDLILEDLAGQEWVEKLAFF